MFVLKHSVTFFTCVVCRRNVRTLTVKVPVEPKKPKTPRKISQEIIQHINLVNPSVINEIPSKFLQCRTGDPEQQFTFDENVAKNIVSAISSVVDLKSTKTAIWEGNPGLGLITKELIKAGVPKLNIFQLSNILPPLQQLITDKPENIKVVNANIFTIYKLLYLDKLDGGKRLENMLNDLIPDTWENEPRIKIIGVVSSQHYIKHLIKSIVFPNKLLAYGRMEHFILVNSTVYNTMISYRKASYSRLFPYAMTNILLDTKVLLTVPKKSFLPWQKLNKKRKQPENSDEMYLLRMVPKRDLFKTLTEQQWCSFWVFLKAISSNRHTRIIPMLEKWVPGCGVVLIAEGLSVFTEIQDLQHSEMVDLFKILINLPGYNDVKFLHSSEMISDSENVDQELILLRKSRSSPQQITV